MDEDERSRVQNVPLAKRIWGLFGKSIGGGECEALHSISKGVIIAELHFRKSTGDFLKEYGIEFDERYVWD